MNFEKVKRPERIIQFGEGGFLRGFVDWMIQKMNDSGERIVVGGRVDAADGAVDLLDIARERLQIEIGLKIVGQMFFDLGGILAHLGRADILGVNGIVKIAPLIADIFQLSLIEQLLHALHLPLDGTVLKGAAAVLALELVAAYVGKRPAAVQAAMLCEVTHEKFLRILSYICYCSICLAKSKGK